MHILYEKSFYKDIAKIKDNDLKVKLIELITSLKIADNLSEVKSIKKMSGYTSYYRIRVNDFRLGLKFSGGVITLIRFIHRKDIYKYFPAK